MKKGGDKALPDHVIASLTVIEGPDRGMVVRLRSRQTRIGRKECDINLSDNKISSEHAKIKYQQRQFMLVDLGSTNGSYIGELQIMEQPLKNMDQIRLGFSTLLFRYNAQDTTATGHESHTSAITSQHELSQASIAEPIVPPKAIEIALTVLTGPYRGQRQLFQKESVVIGRVNCDMLLKDDNDVSRKHAVIEILAGNQLFLRDLTSANGTFLNNQRIANTRINSGDEIRVGNSTMRLTYKMDNDRA